MIFIIINICVIHIYIYMIEYKLKNIIIIYM